MTKRKREGSISGTITYGGIIAALYIVLTLLANAFGLASGVVQLRVSEALCILPCFFPEAIPGLFVGCLISNVISGGVIWDIVFGTLATLIGACLAALFRKLPYLSPIPTVASNSIILPLMFIISGIGLWDTLPLYMLFVFIGETISCGVLGDLLVLLIRRNPKIKKLLSD